MIINIALTGRAKSGKSSLLSCVYEAMRESERGKFLMPNPQEANALTNTYNELRKNASGKSDFTVKINAPGEASQSLIKLQCKGSEADFLFHDICSSNNDNRGANIFIAVIDAPLFMEKHYEESGLPEAVKIFTESLESSKENKMLLIVPVKSEAYKNDELARKIAGHESLSELIKLSQNNEKYSGRSVISVLPVHTMGNMIFRDFTESNGIIESENFTSKTGAEFKPQYADQVFRLIMQFLMSEMTNNRDSSKTLKNIFRSNEIRDTAFHIAQGANNALYSCLCGASLLEIKPEVRKSFAQSAKKFLMIGFAAVIFAGVFAYISGLRTDKSSLYEDLRDERTLTAELENKISELEKSLSNANSLLRIEQGKNKSASEEVLRLNDKIHALNDENKTLRDAISMRQTENEAASQKIKTLEKEGIITRADRSELEERLNAALAEISRLTKSNQKLDKDLKKVQDDYKKLKKKHDSLWIKI